MIFGTKTEFRPSSAHSSHYKKKKKPHKIVSLILSQEVQIKTIQSHCSSINVRKLALFSFDNTLPMVDVKTAETKLRLRQPYQQTCQGKCRHCISITTPNVVSTIQAKNIEYTNLLKGKTRNLNCSKTFFIRCLKCNQKCQKQWKIFVFFNIFEKKHYKQLEV